VSLADEIRRVLMERPEILVEVLTAKPEIVYEALARLMPWQNLATKEDLRRLEEDGHEGRLEEVRGEDGYEGGS